MKYENVKCPVCDEVFTADSDIVVCPECGTPHHRDCYAKCGDCANAEKHAEGFSFVTPKVQTSKNEKAHTKQEPPKVITGGVITPKEAPNGAIPAIEMDRDGNTRPVYRTINGDEKIGEFTVEEYGKVVQKNIHKYAPKFLVLERTDRKVSINWAAFFFGPLWLFYRKMYKYGLISLLVVAFLPMVFIGDIVQYTNEYADVYAELAEFMMSDADMSDAELTAKTEELTKKMPTEPKALIVSNYLDTAISIFLGLFGNALYQSHCKEILVAAKPKRENPEEWEATLKKQGGCSLLSVIVAYAVLALIMAAASAIYVTTSTDLATLLRGLING